MNDWDLRKLRLLRALDELGTVRAAAEALRMTPSGVSQQLAVLSRELGVPLLEAHGRRVRLTSSAHVVLRHADALFAQVERGRAELEEHRRGEAGEVRVGAFATAIPGVVIPAVERLRSSCPRLAVRVREAEAAEVYDLLASGDIEIALSLAVDAPASGDARFTRSSLLADPLDVALPVHHRLADAPGLRLADLAGEPWIYGDSGPWRDITLTACADAGFVPERAHVAADWAVILAMVGAGLGVALVPRLAAPRSGGGAVIRELPADRPRRHVVSAVRAGAEDRPHVARVLRALGEAAAGRG
ncbi:DNA-binding transcriptional LysR family regulator [Nocardiopsis mwathae]|uniref:DNA-binding transcriptional LysR family regulator n=1 Tax=Nocardiopsis mwathae TaxID=1472723 RepID=A0A7W9YMD1_9ACTN|nr:LysR family transcriptional regulator [Nocardiopsis mwathae]MBB6174226.1 DNA-binding transcriptional LysR family regulator [Nocardiopsis mwathae]